VLTSTQAPDMSRQQSSQCRATQCKSELPAKISKVSPLDGLLRRLELGFGLKLGLLRHPRGPR